ncbi:hypothetical protein A1D22_10895 [Pasteurellaceae bacterium LFhippo2]|nr:hypothetical protein [Pasteurellaceae bacterium LFhippo2]
MESEIKATIANYAKNTAAQFADLTPERRRALMRAGYFEAKTDRQKQEALQLADRFEEKEQQELAELKEKGIDLINLKLKIEYYDINNKQR